MPRQSELFKLLVTPEPAELGPGPRTGVQPQTALEERVGELLGATTEISDNDRKLVRALILLWHDHLDAAHTLAQSVENPDGAYVHGILHRREPDYGNAEYWFRRVGRHEAFVELTRRAGELPGSSEKIELRKKLMPKGEWDPFAFVTACEQAANGAVSKDDQKYLREIQRVEFEVLLANLLGDDI